MRIKTNSLEIECDAADWLIAMDAMREMLAMMPSGAPIVRVAMRADVETENEERALRDEYAGAMGKGFSMKGKTGSAIQHLRAWKGGDVESPSADVADAGEAFF